MENKIRENIAAIFDGVKGVANTRQVVGEPYTIGDTTIIPFLETSIGAGFGAFNENKDAGGMAVKVKPIACLVIQNGFTKLINIQEQDVVSKALDLIPDLVNKITGKGISNEEMNDAIEDIQDSYED
ncbi:MAG: GerW family sporulation protein [Lachnospiraceae bacterium]|nr:GerW family sporulation protein [Lachnospiraceae bacterium]